jgi:hypothetical protein
MPICLTPPGSGTNLSFTCQTCGQSTMQNHILLGYYSASAERVCGSWEVDTVDGRVVRITAILSDPSIYKWKDARYVGDIITGSQRNHYQGQYDSDIFMDDVNMEPPASTQNKPLQLGDTCRKCKSVVKERQLLTSTYIGCMC